LCRRLDRIEASDPIDRCELLGLVQFVAQLADNPIIDFYSRCLAAFEARFHPSLRERLPNELHAEYFALVRGLVEDASDERCDALNRAKSRSATLLLEMSLSRPF
jgi:hypothetical protein